MEGGTGQVVGGRRTGSASGLVCVLGLRARKPRVVILGPDTKPSGVPTHVGIDKKAAEEECDYITDGRFEKFTLKRLDGVWAVAMDMWEPVTGSACRYLSDTDNRIRFAAGSQSPAGWLNPMIGVAKNLKGHEAGLMTNAGAKVPP